jgi:hypothetical protein
MYLLGLLSGDELSGDELSGDELSGDDMNQSGGRELGSGKRPEAKETDRLQVRTSDSKRRPTEAENRLLAAAGGVHFIDEGGAAAYRRDLGALRGKPDEVRKSVTDVELATPNDHNLPGPSTTS